MPEDGLAKIFGYLHVNKTAMLYEATVQTWILMIGSVEKLNGRQSCPAKIGTGGNIWQSRASLLAVMKAPDASRTGWATARVL